MRTLRGLDLFCGAGGASMGYHRAGFEMTGVDNRPQPRYPFRFILADALAYVAAHGHEYDAIFASPPCQAFSPLRALSPEKTYPDLIAATRGALQATGLPWVIENVVGAPLMHGIMLCGTMFGLRIYRHRKFESSVMMMQPPHSKHTIRACTKDRRTGWDAGLFASVTGAGNAYVFAKAMEIDWMTGNELSQAIPPAYTELIGSQIRRHIELRA